jgi:hypothetical protein
MHNPYYLQFFLYDGNNVADSGLWNLAEPQVKHYWLYIGLYSGAMPNSIFQKIQQNLPCYSTYLNNLNTYLSADRTKLKE